MKTITADQIRAIIDAHKRLTKAADAAHAAGVLDIEGPLFKAIFETFETMVGILDPDEWILWHIHENGCGKRKLKVAINGKRHVVRNAHDLAKVMNLHNKSTLITTSPCPT